MKAFRRVTSHAVALDRPDVDTDQIIPKQFLKRIERTGFGEFLFWDWARHPDGSINQDFELHQPSAKGASVLVTRRNFGSGSSREHAVWAIENYGFRAVIAPSYGDIFSGNAVQNGLLTAIVSDDEAERYYASHRSEFSQRTFDQVREGIKAALETTGSPQRWLHYLEALESQAVIEWVRANVARLYSDGLVQRAKALK